MATAMEVGLDDVWRRDGFSSLISSCPDGFIIDRSVLLYYCCCCVTSTLRGRLLWCYYLLLLPYGCTLDLYFPFYLCARLWVGGWAGTLSLCLPACGASCVCVSVRGRVSVYEACVCSARADCAFTRVISLTVISLRWG